MSNKDEMNINNKILRWARETAGYSLSDITSHLKGSWKTITDNTLEDWEKGNAKPTLTQLIKLSELYKRPLALFFVTNIPKEINIPPEFRTLAENEEIHLTPKVLLAIRKARQLQENYKLISENLGEEYIFGIKQYKREQIRAKELAIEMRNLFDFNLERIKKIKGNQDLFKILRNFVEEKNCIVVKSARHNAFSTDDARAFSLVDLEPFLINLTSKDSESGRIFSLMHEFCHVLLRESSIIAGDEVNILNKNNLLEQYCNEFASNFLVNRDELKTEYTALTFGTIQEKIDRLSGIFKVSYYVVLYALVDIGLVSQERCKALVIERKKFLSTIKKKKGGGITRPDREVFVNLGSRVVNLFVEAQVRERITYTDLTDYLGVKMKYLPAIFQLSQYE